MKWKLYFDWASRNNPWEASIWYVIFDETWNEIKKWWEYIWIKTNNEAEYIALIKWLEEMFLLWFDEIEIFWDSNLVIKQSLWEWKIKEERLKILSEESKKIIWDKKVNFFYIPREKNKIADKMANYYLDLKKQNENTTNWR